MDILRTGNAFGECRCCLSKGSHRHMMEEYSHNGVREVYIDLIMDCLNLLLVRDPRLTMLICSKCIKRLRDASNFRRMVTASQQQLLEVINVNDTLFIDMHLEDSEIDDIKKENVTVKTEHYKNLDREEPIRPENVVKETVKWEDDTEGSHDPEWLSDVEGAPEYSLENEVKTGLENEKIVDNDAATHKSSNSSPRKRKQNGDSKTTRKKKKEVDTDSDTPISEISTAKRKNKEKKMVRNKSSDVKTYSFPKTKCSKRESLKDNNNLRSNICLILKHSTILPFRNNFKSQYNCFYCEKHYTFFKELREHIETSHTNITEETIDKCLRSLQDLIVSADISKVHCRICNEELKTIDNIIEHLANVHGKIFNDTKRQPSNGILGYDLSSEDLKCYICKKDFAFFKNLTIHMNEHIGMFVCYVCGKKFLSEHRLRCHVFSHHESKDTKCKHCGETLKTEASLAYHIKKFHLKRTIKCPKCPLTFPFTHYQTRLNHMAEVHNIKKPIFKCDTCGKEYANSGSLAAHKRYTHRRTKEHRCEICGYITVHNTVMKNHMDVHNGVKNYECEFCKRKFAKPYTLKLHLKIHLNDKRFVCVICEAAFIQKNSLKNHLRVRHPECGIDVSKL